MGYFSELLSSPTKKRTVAINTSTPSNRKKRPSFSRSESPSPFEGKRIRYLPPTPDAPDTRKPLYSFDGAMLDLGPSSDIPSDVNGSRAANPHIRKAENLANEAVHRYGPQVSANLGISSRSVSPELESSNELDDWDEDAVEIGTLEDLPAETNGYREGPTMLERMEKRFDETRSSYGPGMAMVYEDGVWKVKDLAQRSAPTVRSVSRTVSSMKSALKDAIRDTGFRLPEFEMPGYQGRVAHPTGVPYAHHRRHPGAPVANPYLAKISEQKAEEFGCVMLNKCLRALLDQGICEQQDVASDEASQTWQAALKRLLARAYAGLHQSNDHDKLCAAKPVWTYQLNTRKFRLGVKIGPVKHEHWGDLVVQRQGTYTGIMMPLYEGWSVPKEAEEDVFLADVSSEGDA